MGKDTFYNVVSRLMDLAISLTLIVIFLPIWIIVPLLIKLDSPGPVLFRHQRLGKHKNPFIMYKFRSMIDGAHELLHANNPELLKKFKQGDWKLESDPRITRLGKILRSITIDEFPQLVNVLKGDMSMVGPRAYMAQEIDEQIIKYPQVKPLLTDIFSIKPGITGPWQVAGRNEVPFNQRARLDAQYARKKSITNDVLILVKTPKAMFSKW
jgi:lipopolysaccharide/colanic/teichoic acid biosynthesis glycosyltransferase